MVNHEQHAIAVGDGKIENLVPMPGDAFQFVTAKRRVPPVDAEQGELSPRGLLNLGGKRLELVFEPDGAPEIGRAVV